MDSKTTHACCVSLAFEDESASYLLRLPNDILCRILDSFEIMDRRYGNIDWDAHRRLYRSPQVQAEHRAKFEMLGNLRLSCSTLNAVVSGMLLPVALIRLGQASVDKLEAFCRNPSLAAGVLGLHIALDYRPDIESFDLFKR